MNVQELKKELLAAGVTEEQLDSLDFTKIEELFDNTQNADELCMEIQNRKKKAKRQRIFLTKHLKKLQVEA